jgi:iron complex outermembrane receptor protein
MDLSIEKATSAALEGKKPTGVSDTLAKITVDYKLPVLKGLSISGGAYHTGSTFKDSANLQKIESYVVFDLGLHYATRIGTHTAKFDLNVANITNKNYWATTYSLGIPRNVAFSMKLAF